jgi:hypothetical protein
MSVPGGGAPAPRAAFEPGVAGDTLALAAAAEGSAPAAGLAGGALGKGAQAESSTTSTEPTPAAAWAQRAGWRGADAPTRRRADNGRNRGAVGAAEGNVTMWLIVEAFLALALLLFAVWWTMFSGRRKGERPGEDDSELPPPG